MNSTMSDRGETPPSGMWPWYNIYQQTYQNGYPQTFGHQGYYPYYSHGHPAQFNGHQPMQGMPPAAAAMKGFVSGGNLQPFNDQNNQLNDGKDGSDQQNKNNDQPSNTDDKGDNNNDKNDSDMPPLPPGPPPPLMRFATPPPPPGTSPNNRFYQPNSMGPVKFSFGAKQQVRPGMTVFGGNSNQLNENSNNQINSNNNNNNNNNNAGGNNNNFFNNAGGGGGGGGKKKRKRNKANKMANSQMLNNISGPPPLPPHVLLKIPPPLPPGPPPADQHPPLPPSPDDASVSHMATGRSDLMDIDNKNILHNSGNDHQMKNIAQRNNFAQRNQMNSIRSNSVLSLEEVPQSLKNYMERCYSKCNTPMDKDRVDIILKGKIMRASSDDTLWTKDWDNEPLPLLANELENVTLKMPSPQHDMSPPPPPRKQGKGLSAALESRLGGRRSFSHKSRSPVRNKSSPKRRRERSESSSSSEENYKSSKSSKSKMKFSKSHSSNSSSKKQKQKQSKSHFYSESAFVEEPVNPELLEKRAARFSSSSSKSDNSNSTFQEYQSPLTSMRRKKGLKLNFDSLNNSFQDLNVEMDFSDCHVVGTCQDIEKQYLRLTTAPEASAVRPPDVLQLSLARIKERWIQNQDYYYACEQLKSVRQDLTVQGIRDDLTVKVYETHARIALEKGDHAEFNQCQSQLRSLYCDVKSQNQPEFTAYRILYYIFTKESMDITNVVATLSEDDKKDECVDHALKVLSAWWLSNYHRLFKLYRNSPRMSSYLIDWFLPRERKLALKAIIKSYRPNLAVEFVSQELAFDKEDDCIEFMTQFSVVYADPERTKIDCKASVTSVCAA